MPKSASTRALLLGGPFFFCFIAGQIGGWGGPMLFGMMVLLLLWMPCMLLATGGPLRQVLPAFLPLAAGIAGFAVGASLPAMLGLPKKFI